MSSSKMSARMRALFTDKELAAPVVKLKPKYQKEQKLSVNWKERATQVIAQDEQLASSSTEKPNPIVNQLDEKLKNTFPTGRPLHDEPDYTVCKYCRHPTLKGGGAMHIRGCLRKKSENTKRKKLEKQALEAKAAGLDVPGEGDGDVPGVGRTKGAKKATTGETKSKKRKADDAKHPKEPKSKKRKEKPAKPDPKPKAPVDVEKQCGVQLANGALCARSLTCKSHSMGAKRAVMGRSQPYDILLAAYQKKNQAKQQKAAIEAGPAPDEDERNALPVDSDEETELVMASIARSVPRPFEHQVLVPVKRKAAYIRMKDMVSSVFRPLANQPQPGYGDGGGMMTNGYGSAGPIAAPRTMVPAPRHAGQDHFPQQSSRKSSVNVSG